MNHWGKVTNDALAAILWKYEERGGRLKVEKVRCRPNEMTKIIIKISIGNMDILIKRNPIFHVKLSEAL